MSVQAIVTENSNFEMVLRSAAKIPGIKINRAKFLRKELSKYFNEDIVEKAINTNPAQAGLCIEDLEKIAKACINNETVKVTALSAVAGVPGAKAMVATIPIDIAQFYGHIIRILQKLAYLYGWQEMFHNDDDELDDETSNQLTLFIGVMFGVNAANAAIAKIAGSVKTKVEKTLVRKALTQGTIYPIVKKTAKLIGIKMTKDIFAKGVGKVVPVVGAVVSGGITYFSFRPMAKQLQKYLIALPITKVDFYKNSHEDNYNDEIIDIDFSDIEVEDI